MPTYSPCPSAIVSRKTRSPEKAPPRILQATRTSWPLRIGSSPTEGSQVYRYTLPDPQITTQDVTAKRRFGRCGSFVYPCKSDPVRNSIDVCNRPASRREDREG